MCNLCRHARFSHAWSQLKESHQYYAQVQGQMAVGERIWCDFVVYTQKGFSIQRIPLDKSFWENAFTKLKLFYDNCVVPEIVSPMHAVGLPVRDMSKLQFLLFTYDVLYKLIVNNKLVLCNVRNFRIFKITFRNLIEICIYIRPANLQNLKILRLLLFIYPHATTSQTQNPLS